MWVLYCKSIILNKYFQVIAKELGPDESLSSFAEVIVHIEDVNDNAPEFEQSNYEVTLLENVTQGVIVTQVLSHLIFIISPFNFLVYNKFVIKLSKKYFIILILPHQNLL